jgi:hypothetical protein
MTVNPVIREDKYPLPRIEDLYAKLADGEKFSKIDLSNAYLQMELEDESKKLVSILIGGYISITAYRLV